MTAAQLSSDFDYLRSAAELRLICRALRDIQDFQDKGGRVFYAVDSDIMKFYTSPTANRKYANAFPSDPDTLETLAWVLAHYIFYELTPGSPLLLIPPHDSEIQRVYLAVARDAALYPFEIVDERSVVDSIFKEHGSDGNGDVLAEELSRKAPNIVRFLYGRGTGPVAETQRFTGLVRRGRVRHIERYVETVAGGSRKLPLPDRNSSKDFAEVRERQDNWYDELRGSKSLRRDRGLVTDDALVLATLQWINEKLKPDEKRLILISGDQAMHKAARACRTHDGQEFVARNVIDPRAFIAELYRGNVDGDARKGTDLIEWLDVFLSRYRPDTADYEKRLQEDILDKTDADGNELARSYIRVNPYLFGGLRYEWGKFVRLASVGRGIAGNDADNTQPLEKKVVAIKGELKERFGGDIGKLLDHHIFETLKGFHIAYAQGGFSSLLPASFKERHYPGARGIPVVRFGEYRVAQRYANRIIDTLKLDVVAEDEGAARDMIQEDSSHYTCYLVYGLAFGAAGAWHSCRTMALQAVRVADAIPEIDRGERSGSEASYLLAVAIRRTARTAKSLPKAREHLKEARKRHAAGTHGAEVDLRYDAEEIATDVAAHHFRLLCAEYISPEVPSLEKCQDRLVALLERSQAQDEEEAMVRSRVQRQVITNLFNVLFFLGSTLSASASQRRTYGI
jgi:hypothetical protein